MALNTLTLSTTSGRYGSAFVATISGQGAGNRLYVHSASRDGFFVVNGTLRCASLPDGPTELQIAERAPGGGYHLTPVTINGSFGGTAAPKAQATSVSTTAGVVYTASRLLGSASTFALLAGSDGNLSIAAATGAITAAAAIGAGVSQAAQIRESAGTLAVEYPVTLTGAVSGTSPTPTPTPIPTGLAAFAAALAAAKAGTSMLTINTYGDSTVAGLGGGAPPAVFGNNGRASSIAQKLQAAFAGVGLASNGADLYGDNDQGGSNPTSFNTAITGMGSWSPTSGLGAGATSLGGYFFAAQNAAGGDFAWTAEGRVFDTLKVKTPTGTGGTVTVLVDGAVVGTIAQTQSTEGQADTVFTVPRGAHTVAVRYGSGGYAFFIGLEVWDGTAKKSVRVRNLGWGGATTAMLSADASGNPWGVLSAFKTMKADLHIIEGGVINDWVQGGQITVAQAMAHLTTMGQAAQTLGGSVLLYGPNRTNPADGNFGTPSAALQQSYVDGMQNLAAQQSWGFLDIKPIVGDWAAMNAAGRMFDGAHPNDAGYAAEAAALYKYITGAS